jgi:hypothetical protein
VLKVNQIGNVSVRTRAFAAYGLGLIGFRATNADRKVINESLVRILDGEGRSMAQRDIPVACLTSIGLCALDSRFEQQGQVVLEKRKPASTLDSREDQLAYMLQYFADKSVAHSTRAHAPTAMARLLSAGDLPDNYAWREAIAQTLIAGLDQHVNLENSLQQSCALALGVIGDADMDPTDIAIRAALMNVKEDLADHQARHFALIALGQAAGRPGHGLGDPIHAVNVANKQQNVRSFLLRELGNGKGAIPSWAAMALAVMERSLDDSRQTSSSDAKLALRSALSTAKSPIDIGALSIACGLVRDVGAKDALLAQLNTVRDQEARGFTAVGLGLINDSSVIPQIQDVVRKSKYQPDLLKSAAIGLGLLGDKQLVDDLLSMLSSASGLSSQAAISSALGFIGDARSIDPLVDMLNKTEVTDLARAFAVVALGIISDREDLPWNSKIGMNSNYRANTVSLTDQKGGILDIL